MLLICCNLYSSHICCTASCTGNRGPIHRKY